MKLNNIWNHQLEITKKLTWILSFVVCTNLLPSYTIMVETTNTQFFLQPGCTLAMCLWKILLRGWATGPSTLSAVVESALIPRYFFCVFLIENMVVPLGWYYIRIYKVYMELIIKGTIPRVPPFSLWFSVRDQKQQLPQCCQICQSFVT